MSSQSNNVLRVRVILGKYIRNILNLNQVKETSPQRVTARLSIGDEALEDRAIGAVVAMAALSKMSRLVADELELPSTDRGVVRASGGIEPARRVDLHDHQLVAGPRGVSESARDVIGSRGADGAVNGQQQHGGRTAAPAPLAAHAASTVNSATADTSCKAVHLASIAVMWCDILSATRCCRDVRDAKAHRWKWDRALPGPTGLSELEARAAAIGSGDPGGLVFL